MPALGAHGAAMLQEALTARAVETAIAAQTGPVTLWATPDATHPSFRELAVKSQIAVKRQPDGDLGARMLAACEAASGPVLVIGTDCPSLSPAHLQEAADALRDGNDVVVIPAEDGGYVLIGTRRPQPIAVRSDAVEHGRCHGRDAQTRRGRETALPRAADAVGYRPAGRSRTPAQ